MHSIPTLILATAPPDWRTRHDLSEFDWQAIPSLSPFLLAQSGKPAEQQTVARLCADEAGIYAHFDCFDRDIWGTFTDADRQPRHQPIFEEEVIELVIGVDDGSTAISRYFEFELNPYGVLLDVAFYNPDSERETIEVDFSWHCPGIRWWVTRLTDQQRWQATLAIPWTALTTERPIPVRWRGNLYRIERPRDGTPPEFSCWSPTMTDPADFHKPAYFGTFIRQLESRIINGT